jgi:hypothetical protein
MNWLKDLPGFLTAVLDNRFAPAIIVGLIFALALTQWIKFVLLRVNWLPDPRRWIIRAIALPIGALATYVTLPASVETVLRVMVSLSVGAIAPYAYEVITAVLVKFWPALEARLSVDPYGDFDAPQRKRKDP